MLLLVDVVVGILILDLFLIVGLCRAAAAGDRGLGRLAGCYD